MRTVLSSSVLALGMFATTGSLPAAAASLPQAERTQRVRSIDARASSYRLAWALSSRLNSIILSTMKVGDDGANVVLLVGEREIGGSAAAAILDDHCQEHEQLVARYWVGTAARTRPWCGSTQSRSLS